MWSAGREARRPTGGILRDVNGRFFYGRGRRRHEGRAQCLHVAAVAGLSRANGTGASPRNGKGLDFRSVHLRRGRHRVNGTYKLLAVAAARAQKCDHAYWRTQQLEELGDCIKVARRGSCRGTLTVDGIHGGPVAFPSRFELRCLIYGDIVSPEQRAARSRQKRISSLQYLFTSVDVALPRAVLPGTARAKFNIRVNIISSRGSWGLYRSAAHDYGGSNRIKARDRW